MSLRTGELPGNTPVVAKVACQRRIKPATGCTGVLRKRFDSSYPSHFKQQNKSMENNQKTQEQHLTHWKRLVNPDYLGVYSLDNGKDMTLTIDRIVREVVTSTGGKKEECTVAYFKEKVKPMILNRTNSKMIQKIYNTPYIEEWAGKKITVYASATKLAGEEVECLRIRQLVPQNPVLKIEDKVNFDKCKSALQNGYTISQLRTKWTITKDVEQALTNEGI